MTEQFICDYLTSLGYQDPWITYTSDMKQVEIKVEFFESCDMDETIIKETLNLWDIVAKMHN